MEMHGAARCKQARFLRTAPRGFVRRKSPSDRCGAQVVSIARQGPEEWRASPPSGDVRRRLGPVRSTIDGGNRE